MQILNYTDFRSGLTKNLKKVTDDAEVVIVNNGSGKNVVLISLEEYNAIQETLYLAKSKNNRKRLDEAIAEMEKGKSVKHKLIEKK
jgi:antitoxin YefM